MAETSKNKIYYNDNEDSIADVLEDMKKLAESTDNAIEKAKYNDTELKNKNTAQDEEIAQIKEKNTAQDSLIEELQAKVVNLESENTSLKNQIPNGEATGNPIHLTDSSDLPCEIAVVGNSEQETREGYNKITYSYSFINLVNTTILDDSANNLIVENTTPGSNSYFFIDNINLEADKTYTISRIYEIMTGTKTDETAQIELYLAGTWKKVLLYQSSSLATFTVDTSGKYRIVIKNGNSSSALKVKYTNLMILEGTYTADTLPPYEQYGAMPSSGYPSPIETVGQNVNIIDYTKLTSFEHYDLTVTQIANGIRVTCNTTTPHINSKYMLINLEKYKGKNLTISANIKSSSSNRGMVLLTFCDSNGGNRSGITYTEETTDGKVSLTKAIPETLTDNTSYLCLMLYGRRSVYDDTQVGEYVDYTEIKLVEGTEVGGYSPYGQGSVEISVDNGLKTTDTNYQSYTKVLPIQKEFVKIGDVEDTFVKVDGKWYEKHDIPKYELTGNESFSRGTTRNGFYYFEATISDLAGNYGKINRILCNVAKEISASDMYEVTSQKDLIGTNSKNIRLMLSDINTVPELQAYLSEQYANETPATLYYLSTTPKLIECTEEQSEILNSFCTYKNVTNVSMIGIATLKVNYKKDLETIINNISATSVAE